MDDRFVHSLSQIAPVHLDAQTIEDYSHDWTENLRFAPSVVVKPRSIEEVAEVVKLCNDFRVPVTPVGARTGLSGGMLPVYGGVALGMEKMNRILELDERNLQITVEAGVITEEIQKAAESVGLMYPPDPSSKGSCTIGGNLAECAGGAHAVKYGVTRDYVLGLKAVTGTGNIIRTGAKVLKNSTGYSLTHLLVGSEGTLAVIAEATLKLIPKPKHDAVMLVAFADPEQACECVSAIFHAKIVPAALEFIERDALEFGQNYLGIHDYELDGVGAHLLVEIDGNDPAVVMNECEAVAAVVERHCAKEILFADEREKKLRLWRLRRCLGEAVKSNSIYKEEDTVVPRAELAKLLRFVKQTGREYGFQSVCYGHAGDGNLHVNILKNDIGDEEWETKIPEAVRKIFEYVCSLGGTISGEHGIGWVQRRYMDVAFSPHELELMRGLKAVFDPNGVLNPGKIFY
ncbi:MAG: FAD-linked oxidase C-terminal domain-containing protein [Bacteroidia bacterium]|nr:FAD-linked oxidase C-terminal domain-containing protein [Bacteroidia bacterium]